MPWATWNEMDKLQFLFHPTIVNEDDETRMILLFNIPLKGTGAVSVGITDPQSSQPKMMPIERINPYTYCFTLQDLDHKDDQCELTLFIEGIEFGRQKLFYRSSSRDFSEEILKILMFIITKMGEHMESHGQLFDELDKLLCDMIDDTEKHKEYNKALTNLFSAWQTNAGSHQQELPTLLHFVGRHGLKGFAQKLIDLPDSCSASKVKNVLEQTPSDVAKEYGYDDLAVVLAQHLQLGKGYSELIQCSPTDAEQRCLNNDVQLRVKSSDKPSMKVEEDRSCCDLIRSGSMRTLNTAGEFSKSRRKCTSESSSNQVSNPQNQIVYSQDQTSDQLYDTPVSRNPKNCPRNETTNTQYEKPALNHQIQTFETMLSEKITAKGNEYPTCGRSNNSRISNKSDISSNSYISVNSFASDTSRISNNSQISNITSGIESADEEVECGVSILTLNERIYENSSEYRQHVMHDAVSGSSTSQSHRPDGVTENLNPSEEDQSTSSTQVVRRTCTKRNSGSQRRAVVLETTEEDSYGPFQFVEVLTSISDQSEGQIRQSKDDEKN